MTDQTAPAVTDKDHRLARDWAQAVESNPSMVSIAARSAARVVLNPAPALPGGWPLADHPRYGRVAVTNTTPNRDGYVCCVSSYDRDGTGFDWHYCRPHELTYLDGEPEADQ